MLYFYFLGKHDDVIKFGDLRRTLHPLVERRTSRDWRRLRLRRFSSDETLDRRIQNDFRSRNSTHFCVDIVNVVNDDDHHNGAAE